LNHEKNFKRTREQLIKHGQGRIKGVRNGTPAYLSWLSMIQRCTDKKSRSYKNYGGRGIGICAQWRNSFEVFFADMGARPKGTTLGRIDGNAGYLPENCEWQTQAVQSRNRRNNHLISFNGLELTIEDWSRETNIFRKTIDRRLAAGWSIERTLTTPVRRMKNNWVAREDDE